MLGMKVRLAFGILVLLVTAFATFMLTCPPTLSIDPGCRNDIQLDHVGGTWLNGGPIPVDWQNRGSVQGTFERLSDDQGIFRSEGFEIPMHEGNATTLACESWPGSEPSDVE